MRTSMIQRLRKFFWVRKELTGLYAVGLCLTLLIALLSVFPTLAIQRSELALYDLMLSGRTQAPQSQVPVVVGIDEDSLTAFGQWPWPRYRLASLVEQLQQLGAQVVVLDFLMPELDRTEAARGERVAVWAEGERLHKVQVGDARLVVHPRLEQGRIGEATDESPGRHVVNENLVGTAASDVLPVRRQSGGVNRMHPRR